MSTQCSFKGKGNGLKKLDSSFSLFSSILTKEIQTGEKEKHLGLSFLIHTRQNNIGQ